MIIFSQLCDHLAYAPQTPSKVAVPLPAALVGREHRAEHCLYLQIGVEHDDQRTLSTAIKAIRRIARRTDAKSLVINGFAGLAAPQRAADAEQARLVLAAMAARLENAGWQLVVMPFGWNKTLTLQVVSGEWAQRVTHLRPRTLAEPAGVPRPPAPALLSALRTLDGAGEIPFEPAAAAPRTRRPATSSTGQRAG